MNDISVYIHWPFCKSKCPYCDFNSHVRAQIDMSAWQESYVKELYHYRDILQGKNIRSIFFGGGTPSLADPKIFARILNELSKIANLSDETEITIEANPTSVEANKFKEFAAAGINRASIGVQSLNDKNLKFLGREHDVHEALHAVELAQRSFKRYSFDLIYTLPNQQIDEWLKDLDYAISLAGDHLSLYQLTIEKGTSFYKDFKARAFIMPDDDTSADFYEATLKYVRSKGFERYEVSNYAKPQGECLHNLTYWRYQDFIGIGPGAHGRYHTQDGAMVATTKIYSPEQWLSAVNEKGVGLQSSQLLSSEQCADEKIIMGMRLKDGVSISSIPNKNAIDDLINMNLLSKNSTHIMATDAGFLVLNSIIEQLTKT